MLNNQKRSVLRHTGDETPEVDRNTFHIENQYNVNIRWKTYKPVL